MQKKQIIAAPSLLACDFSNILPQLRETQEGGAEYLHLDVMDGMFVPNISFGQPLIQSLRKHSKMVFDTHLMIVNPERYIDDFAAAGADIITIHSEASDKTLETLRKIRSLGLKSGLSIKPGTPADTIFDLLKECDMVLVMSVEPGFGGQKFMPASLDKLKILRAEADRQGLKLDLQIDGGIGAGNAADCVRAGANILVAGSSVFGQPDIAAAVKSLLDAAKGGLD